MINLVNTSLYSFNKTYDYQSVCDPEKDSKAAAGPRSIYVVRHLLLLCITFGSLFNLGSIAAFVLDFFFSPQVFLFLLQPTIADLLSIGWWASTAAW